MQALKKVHREGELYPPGVTQETIAKEGTKKGHRRCSQPRGAIEEYQSERNDLQKKDSATYAREDSSLKKWVLGFGERALSSVDAKMYKDYAIFCKEHAAQRPSLKKFWGDNIHSAEKPLVSFSSPSWG
jgi:hypothetical protein